MNPLLGSSVHVYPRLSWVPIPERSHTWGHLLPGAPAVGIVWKLCACVSGVLPVSVPVSPWLPASACPFRDLRGLGPPSSPSLRLRHALPMDTRGRCGLAVTPAGGSGSCRVLQRGMGSSSRPQARPRASVSALGGVGGGGWDDGAQNSRGHGRGCYSRPGHAVLAACPAGRGLLGLEVPVGPSTNRPSAEAAPAP